MINAIGNIAEFELTSNGLDISSEKFEGCIKFVSEGICKVQIRHRFSRVRNVSYAVSAKEKEVSDKPFKRKTMFN